MRWIQRGLAALALLLPSLASAQVLRLDPPYLCAPAGGTLSIVITNPATYGTVVFVSAGGARIFLGSGMGSFTIAIPVPAMPFTAQVTIESWSLDLSNPYAAIWQTSRIFTLYKLESQTLATAPGNPDPKRVQIGLGEQVLVRTSPAVNLNWAVDNGGTVTPAWGSSTTFEARKDPVVHTVTGQFGGNGCQMTFTVRAPQSVRYTFNHLGTLGTPGTNRIGVRAYFDFDHVPSIVSFARANMRENIPAQSWTWPSGSIGNWPVQVVPFAWSTPLQDQFAYYYEPITRLQRPNGQWSDFTFNINVPLEYQNSAGAWVGWLATNIHQKTWAGASVSVRGQGWLNAYANNTAQSPPQGPFQ